MSLQRRAHLRGHSDVGCQGVTAWRNQPPIGGLNRHFACTYTVTVCCPGLTGVVSASIGAGDAIALSYIGRGGTVGPPVDISIRLPNDPPAARAMASASARALATAAAIACRRASSIDEA